MLDLGDVKPKEVAKFLKVSESTVFRWLADESAPYSALAALWHETPYGRHVTALDVGNELQIYYSLCRCLEQDLIKAHLHIESLLSLNHYGSANDPVLLELITQPRRSTRIRHFEVDDLPLLELEAEIA